MIKKVAVIGAGTMGNQIAMQTAICGYETICYSRSQKTVDHAKTFSDEWFTNRIAKGKMTEELANESQARLAFTTDLKVASTNADLVIECVADVLEIKRKILSEIDQYTNENTIYGSNSSYIVSSLFADSVRHPEKVLNVHFFNPALVMKLVEVVQGPHVSDETVETVMEFIKSIKKTSVLVKKEIYGFVVNRIYSALSKEACYLLDQKVASFEDIDIAVKNGLGHPMGPFQVLDMVGIDLEYQVQMERYRTTGDVKDKPSPSLVEKYARGEYGTKTKKGFYSYEK